METTYDVIAKVLIEKFGVDEADVSPDVTLKDLQLDSLAALEVADVLKEVCGFAGDDSSFREGTLSEIAQGLDRQMGRAE
ncbi:MULTISPECIES: acyl carrier protein [Streptomyces]|uniref:acyl carrier protein n=1 Tax=Streptomyces TaxID=1883 RepID=UPI0023DD05BE|nr:acyl carrier protein [Streptomyces sp. FXJ1.172]WEP00549.1 acyl carrier protein [Streptomyces sp. FXJ1.172]